MSAAGKPWSARELACLCTACSAAGFYVDDWIAAAAVAILWLAWRYLRDPDGLPILPIALSFQWLQVTAGIWYFALTDRRLPTMTLSDYRPMVLIGLGCVLSLVIGIHAGRSMIGPGAAASH